MKKTMQALAVMVIIWGSSVQGQVARTKVNLIPDPGFESGSTGDLSGWNFKMPGNKLNFRTGIDSVIAHHGNYSGKISEVWSGSSEPGISTAKPVPIDPVKKYILGFWYKTSRIEEYPMALVSKFTVSCRKTLPVKYRKRISNSDQWKECLILLDNIPADAVNVSIEFCTDVCTRGSIWLDDIEFREAGIQDIKKFEKWRRQPVPRIDSRADDRGSEATGFFRVENKNGRWWFADPSGKPFWALAVAGALGAAGQDNPATQTAWFKKEFGPTPASYAEKLYSIFTGDCGFNSLAGWTSEKIAAVSARRFATGQSYMPVTQVLGLSSIEEAPDIYVRDKNGKSLNKPGHPMVDPFNSQWRRLAREKAERVIPSFAGKPWFIGWYIDNEIDFKNLYRYVWAEYSSKEFIRYLSAKYSSVESLNRRWTSSFGEYRYDSFEEILAGKPEPKHWDDPLYQDFITFERKMLEEYINFTCNLVRELDPGHLVISDRIHLTPMTDFWRTADLWSRYDIVCMNIYPENNKIGFDTGEIEIMKKLHRGTGRPVIIGEWSVPAIDSGLYGFGPDSLGRPLDWSWPQVLRTQKERGEVYETCMRQLASLPFVVGAGWFITMDVNTKERRANRGLMNNRFEMYRELVASMKKTNEYIGKKLNPE